MASHTHLDPSNKISANSLINTHQSRKLTTIELVGGIFCHICQTTFGNKKDYDIHYIEHSTSGTNIAYTCVVCHKTIVGYASFRGHCYTNHVTKEKYKCDHCEKQFSKITGLKDHIMVKHKIKCPSCSKIFQSKKEMQIHQIIHNNNDKPPYNCQTCQKKINCLNGCEDHIDLHTSFTYPCPICSEASTNKQVALEHLKKHFSAQTKGETASEVQKNTDDETNFIEKLGGIFCCICMTVHKDRVNFDAHFSLKHGCQDIVYTCNKCKKKFDKYSVFHNHCYNHFMKNRFVCHECFKSFARLSLLVTHTEAYHGGNATGLKPFQCAHCTQCFATEKTLRSHLREMHDTAHFKCLHNGCERIFETPKEMILHQRQHNDSQNWCRQCGILFTTLFSCENHLDVHRKNTYSCPVCGRNYGEKHLVIKHLSKHFESVLHICKVCGKIYNAKNRLVEHIKVHSDMKTHTCKHCGRGFTKLNHLEQHLNIHSGVRPHKCNVCPKTFASYPNLRKHLHRMHSIHRQEIKKTFNMKTDNSNEGIDDKATNENMEVITTNCVPDTEIAEDEIQDKLFEPINSTMESDGIDPVVIEKELQIFEATSNITSTNMLPDNPALFISETTQEPSWSVTEELAPLDTINLPREYGPEFNSGLDATDNTGFIDLDDHILPHIDPLLTIKNDELNANLYVQNLSNYQYENFEGTANYNANTKWEPIITRVYQDYACGYEEISDTNRLSFMNTDIF